MPVDSCMKESLRVGCLMARDVKSAWMEVAMMESLLMEEGKEKEGCWIKMGIFIKDSF